MGHPQLRRNLARGRFAATLLEAQGLDSGELEAGRGCDYLRRGLERRRTENLPRIQDCEAVSANDEAAAVIG